VRDGCPQGAAPAAQSGQRRRRCRLRAPSWDPLVAARGRPARSLNLERYMSDPLHTEPADSPAVVSNRSMDSVVAIVVFIVGVVVVVQARGLGAEWTSDGPGAGYFPFYIGLILCIAGLGVFYQARFGKNRDTDPFVDREQLKRVMSVLLPAVVYVLCIAFFGLYVASAIYIALFMIILGKYSPLKSVLLAVMVVAAFFVMFEVWFKVPLYKGALEPLRFLGY
jgi:Tripartite tricarboxylate transporter TctB family